MARDPFPDKASPSSGTAPLGAYVLDDYISDDNDLPVPVRAIRAGADGTLTVVTPESDIHPVISGVTIEYSVAAGEEIRGPIARVMSTGTTASDLVGYV